MNLVSSHCPGCWHGHPVPLSSAGPSQRCCGDATTACSLPCCEGEAKLLRKSHFHQPLLSSGSQCELAQPWVGHRPALPGGYGTGELGFGSRAQLGQSVHTALPHGSLWGPQPGTWLLCHHLLRAIKSLHTQCSPCSSREQLCTHGCPSSREAWRPSWKAKAAGSWEGWTAHPADPSTPSTLAALQLSSQPLVLQKASWGLRELHTPTGLTTAGTSVPGSSCGRCAPGFRLSASPWGTGSGVRAGWSTVCRAAASDPCLASQNTSSHRGVEHLCDWPQRMHPIATCLPVLGKRGGKKERSSPRQVLPGAVVSECRHCGGAGLAGEGKGQEVVVEV